MSHSPIVLTAALALLLPLATSAAPTPAQKCEASIENAAGSFFQCRLKAEAAFTLKSDAAKRDIAFAKCVDALAKKFDKVLTDKKVGPACPVTEPVGAFAGVLIQRASNVSSAAAGASFPECGDGVVNAAGEHCDTSDLGGTTCASLGFVSGTLGCTLGCKFNTSACVSGGGGGQAFPATGQTTCWDPADTTVPIDTIACAGTGQDGETQAGATLAFQDNGDGTISDLNTALMWEKLAWDGSIHDWTTFYTWANAFTVKIAALNSPPCFAGHCDWRLPNRRELESIETAESIWSPVPPPFPIICTPHCTVMDCNCLNHWGSWSATTYAESPEYAWIVWELGFNGISIKSSKSHQVRAVRAGA